MLCKTIYVKSLIVSLQTSSQQQPKLVPQTNNTTTSNKNESLSLEDLRKLIPGNDTFELSAIFSIVKENVDTLKAVGSFHHVIVIFIQLRAAGKRSFCDPNAITAKWWQVRVSQIKGFLFAKLLWGTHKSKFSVFKNGARKSK